MSATPVNDLLDEAKCFTCLGLSIAESLVLAELQRIDGGDAPPCGTPTSVLVVSGATSVPAVNGNYNFVSSTTWLHASGDYKIQFFIGQWIITPTAFTDIYYDFIGANFPCDEWRANTAPAPAPTVAYG